MNLRTIALAVVAIVLASTIVGVAFRLMWMLWRFGIVALVAIVIFLVLDHVLVTRSNNRTHHGPSGQD